MRKKDIYKLQEAVVQQVINDTGKVPDVKITILPNGRRKKIADFIYIFQNVEFLLVQILAPSSCKVLMYLRAVSEYHNKIDKDISEIATWTNLSEISVKRSLKELNENKIITTIKSNSDNRRNVYLINPQSSWKGVIEKAQQLYPYFNLTSMQKNANQLELELKDVLDGETKKIQSNSESE
jgi:DNA-binding MarR family transcriptional regulator